MTGQGTLIQRHQLPLTHGGGGLKRYHRFRTLRQAETLTAEPDGTAGDQHHPIPTRKCGSNAGGIAIDRCRRIATQQAGSQLHHPQRHAMGAPNQWARRRSSR